MGFTSANKYSVNTSNIQSSSLNTRTKYSQRFTYCHIAVLLVSVITFLADIVSDVITAIHYAKAGHTIWFALTCSLAVLPTIVIQLISIRWYHIDKNITITAVICHILGFGQIYRYCRTIQAGWRITYTTDDETVQQIYHDQNDACMLRLFEAFLESAPQSLLQLYIIVCTHDQNWFSATCALMSLISLCWAVVTYSHALRQACQSDYKVSYFGLVLIFLWRSLIISSRILILIVTASWVHEWTALVLGVRWIFMFIWLSLQKTNFTTHCVEERIFNMIVAVIGLFMFLNVSDGHTRYRVLIYYTATACEGVLLYLLWYFLCGTKLWTPLEVGSVISSLFVSGLITMVIYYRFFHPNGPIRPWRKEQKEKPEEKVSNCSTQCSDSLVVTET